MRVRLIAWSFLSFLSLAAQAAEWDQRIVEVRSGQTLSFEELSRRLRSVDRVVIGEKHNTPAVQQAEARLVEALGAGEPWTLAWEFLDFSSQARSDEAYQGFALGRIDALEFLRQTQGDIRNATYVSVLDSLKAVGGSLLGVNLSRQEKAPIVRGGLSAADPRLIPSGFEMGGAAYRERFEAAMSGGHATPEQIENYFAAQCVTDDVMAFHLAGSVAHQRAALIAGSFHTDFFDGVVQRLLVRMPQARLSLVKVVDASDYAAVELPALGRDPRYGDIADFLFFVNEPAATSAEPEAPAQLERSRPGSSRTIHR